MLKQSAKNVEGGEVGLRSLEACEVARKSIDCRFASPDTDEDDYTGASSPPIEALHPLDARAIPKKPLHYRFIKRAFDIAFSACVIVVGFIPCVVLSAFIAADTKGSPIYTSVRIGRGGRPFKMLKFRSMVSDSDDLERHLAPDQIEQWHREHKVDGDPRVTKLGAFLRATSIDEIPQFLNVLLGQLSVIGPRAITLEELENFGANRDVLLSCPPGVTGLWQTGPRNVATFESGLRQELELAYVRQAGLKLDTKLFFKTFKTMVDGTGK